jgi:uncharacterized protein (TIGR04222 family)
MDNDDRGIAERMQRFELDEPQATFPFTRRLARDNLWSHVYAQRVVREYKRFALLAATCGRPVTPSDQVDQAWHLHLLYTESYARFCAEVLRVPLHHRPTQGGPDEALKFRAWYERTVELYRDRFGEPPPSDIWPPADQRFSEDMHHARVHTRRNWIVPRPAMLLVDLRARTCARRGRLGSARLPAVAAVVACAATGCALIGTLPPFDLSGPESLTFFVILWALTYLLARRLTSAADEPEHVAVTPKLDAYEVAYLAGGAELGTAAAIAGLVDRGCLRYDAADQRFRAETHPHDDDVHHIELAVWNDVDAAKKQGRELSKVTRRAARLFDPIAYRLRALDLLGERRAPGPLLVASIAPVLGAIKVGLGIARDKPVAFLVLLCSVSAVVAWAQFGRRSHRSRRGDAVLVQLRTEHAHLELGRVGSDGGLYPAPLAVALFGVAVLGISALADSAVAQLHDVFQRSQSSGSGHGGGGCGGGDGGGCGGGGCGGCG